LFGLNTEPQDGTDMSEKCTNTSGKITESAEVIHMSAGTEAVSLIEAIAAPCTVKDAMNRVARLVSSELRRAGLPPMKASRVEDIWRAEARSIRADEMDALRRARDKALKQEAQDELSQLRARIERLEAALRVSDADFFGPQLDALGGMARGAHRPVD
jgi:cell division septum initiation protein DivIVA